jgi:hypothetical protein
LYSAYRIFYIARSIIIEGEPAERAIFREGVRIERGRNGN